MAKKKRPLYKAFEALFEGRFFRKCGVIIAERWNQLWKAIDFFFGKISRYFLMKSIDIDPKKIVFIPFQGDYTCNLKYVCEELLRRDTECRIVWAVRETTMNAQFMYSSRITFVEQYTLDYYLELASAQVWIVNSVDFLKRKVYKKKEQILIETWHGSLGIKRFDAAVNAGKPWVRAARYCGKVADYCISNSSFENDVYRGTFWPDTPLLEIGHPRNDVLLRREQADHAVARARDLLNLPEGVRFALYAPTFRDDHDFNAYSLDYRRLTDSLERRFGGTWMVITRFHPTVRKFVGSRGRLEDCIDATAYDDIQELMCLVDVAITDYSSWIFDYVLTRKPGFIFATDLARYNTERGFYYPLEEAPFPVSTDNDQLVDAIASFDETRYLQSVDSFLASKGCVEDGHASERLVDLLQKELNLKSEEQGIEVPKSENDARE